MWRPPPNSVQELCIVSCGNRNRELHRSGAQHHARGGLKTGPFAGGALEAEPGWFPTDTLPVALAAWRRTRIASSGLKS